MPGLIRRTTAGAAVAVLGLVAGLVSALPASAASAASAAPAHWPAPSGTYLALGDSVAFGFVPPGAVPPPNYHDASSFVGYPEDVARALRLRVANAACPGETTASLFIPGVVSNGCENSPGSSTGYRTQYPLHVFYKGTQLRFALKYLARHPHT